MPKKSVSSNSKKTVNKRLINPQKGGVSKMVLIGAGVFAVLIIAVGGYLVMGQKMGLGKIPLLPAKVALNSDCVYKDPELCRFINNIETQTNYVITSSSTIGGSNVESVFEFSGEDKTHMLTKEGGKEISNTIIIGDTSYTLDYADNKWLKLTSTPAKTETSSGASMKDQFAVDTTDTDPTVYKFVTKEACGDKNCFKYSITYGDSTDSEQFIWFDDQDYLLRKISIGDKTNGYSDSIYTYGGVNISAPSPVKEGDSTGSMDVNSDKDVQKMMQQYQNQAPVEDSSSDQEMPVSDDSSDY